MGKQHTYDWQFHIRQQEASGLSVKDYSLQQGFTAWSFYMNRKRLQASSSTEHPFALPPLKTQQVNSSSIVHVGSINSSQELTVTFRDGTTVHYSGSISVHNLSDLLCALRHTSKRSHKC